MHVPAPHSGDLKGANDLPAKTRLLGATAYSNAADTARIMSEVGMRLIPLALRNYASERCMRRHHEHPRRSSSDGAAQQATRNDG